MFQVTGKQTNKQIEGHCLPVGA